MAGRRGREGHSGLGIGTGAVLVALALVVGIASLASAKVAKDSFPDKGSVKEAVQGTGKWRKSIAQPDEGHPIGSKPGKCGSDRPFRDAGAFRLAFYNGSPPAGVDADGTSVRVVVYDFGNKQRAKKSMARASTYADRCPENTEWYCKQCDGIADYVRLPTSTRDVGQESTAWRSKVDSNAKGREVVVVARDGSVVVKTTVQNDNYPGQTFERPEAPSKKSAAKAAKLALRSAT